MIFFYLINGIKINKINRSFIFPASKITEIKLLPTKSVSKPVGGDGKLHPLQISGYAPEQNYLLAVLP